MIVFIFYYLSLRFGDSGRDALARAGLGVTRSRALGLQGVRTRQMTEGRVPIDTPRLTEALEGGRKAAEDTFGCGVHDLLFSMISTV